MYRRSGIYTGTIFDYFGGSSIPVSGPIWTIVTEYWNIIINHLFVLQTANFGQIQRMIGASRDLEDYLRKNIRHRRYTPIAFFFSRVFGRGRIGRRS